MAGIVGEEDWDRAFVGDARVEVAAESVCAARRRTDGEDYFVFDGF